MSILARHPGSLICRRAASLNVDRIAGTRLAPVMFRSTQLTRQMSSRPQTTKLVIPQDAKTVYEGPYSKTFKYLKLFSLSSLGLSAALSPFIFILESSLPTSGRIFLAVTAISTTTFSTYLISLFTGPYVNRIVRGAADAQYPFILSTTSMFLQERNTFINDQGILAPSERPLTTWKLREQADSVVDAPSLEAVTTDRTGKVLGRWNVEGGKATHTGSVVRYFNVHPELLETRFTSDS
ncbi:hypothetical protein FFLO_06488 [Filobasidium floriforme]|uniref:Uncharacterized protein n=1 Tax=Filobasidium floriforme TaxID=5210 RepID=A0A8K0JER9_9TREE|nr:uncharacterized protein HD553DRAFT_167304 [Filobasidium floriforme]KAG7527946.1 hypothetical protein FFLO_06488 [Filobasidium floriforme]KAH8077676.1 hypothetical protein HD553DRAFT_167304 [Filobasidium floriforme]